jgi:hypothetical protein
MTTHNCSNGELHFHDFALEQPLEGSSERQTLFFPNIWNARAMDHYHIALFLLRPALNTLADKHEADGHNKLDAIMKALETVSANHASMMIQESIKSRRRLFGEFMARYGVPLLIGSYALSDLMSERLTGTIPATEGDVLDVLHPAYANDGWDLLTRTCPVVRKQFEDEVAGFLAEKFRGTPKKKSKRKAASKARKGARKR